jgi:hypothetical protein
MPIMTTPRPYLLTFRYGTRTGAQSYPITSEGAQRLIDDYPALTATRTRVVLRGDSPGMTATLTPATRGGGPAFLVTR